jgi:PAS domain S-box-containing protein
MQAQAEDPVQEIKRLQRCINDLVSLLALPAVWSGNESSHIVDILLGALLRMLRLDFIYARLEKPVAAAPLEVIRVGDTGKLKLESQQIRLMLGRWFGGGTRESPPPTRSRFGGVEISIFPLLLGIHGGIGVIVVGSQRADFPTQTESLLLSVAVNQASFALQEARLLSEQRQVSSELDQRVAQRTSELAAANEELKKGIADRKRAEEALRGSEQSLRLVLDGIAGLVAIMGATGEVEAVNRQVLDYFGSSLEEMKGWSTSDAVHQDDLPGVISAWRHSVETASPYDVDHRMRGADGVYRWFHARGLPLRNAEGQVLRWYVLLTDIDDRRRAEEALRASEVKLRRVIDTIPTLAWCNLPDGPNEFLSKPWHDYTGLSPEESDGWGWQVAFHPQDLPGLMKKWQELLISGEPGEIEARLRRGDGVYRWFLIRVAPFRDDTGTIVRWYGTSTDIEDRKRAEDAVLANERNLGLIISTMPVLAWSARAEGNVDFLNQRWLDYTGLSLAEALDWGWAKVFHPHDLAIVNEYWRSRIASGEPGAIEARLRRFDGSYRWFLFRASPLHDESGAIVKWYGTNTDIDDRKRAEEELRVAQSELARVTRAMTMGQLTASMAHEVNQPLSGIITNASACLRMLDTNPPNLEGARETARRTIRDGHRASDVITRLRTLYSKKEPALEPMDLNEAAREVTALSSTEVQKNGVTLRQEFADGLPPALGDRIQLQQVILNLLRNAADAMSTIDDRPRELLIRTERDEGNHVRLSVKDSGVGFAPQVAGKIFEAFYTTKTDGMGIGLSVSRSIIEAHQGRLWATPNEGPGCTFSFAIPCALEGLSGSETRVSRA